ncbi:MAG TPA: GtrA family protein [Hyphomicrobiaceae bacterium]|nr:GtrA family protein [Hyphomicrobiaceae bacterium]
MSQQPTTPRFHNPHPGASRSGVALLSRITGFVQWLRAFAYTPGRALEFIQYGGASAVALAFDTSVFLALIHATALSPAAAGAIGYASGMVLSYTIAVRFIFNIDGKSHHRLIAGYAATGLFGVALTYLLVGFLTTHAGAPPLIAKLLTVGVVFVAVYVIRAGRVFASK